MVLSKKKAKKFATDVVQKWKGFDLEEDAKKRDKETENFLNKNNLFEKTWKKFDTTGKQSGSIDMMESHDLIKKIIPQADNVQSKLEDSIDKALDS